MAGGCLYHFLGLPVFPGWGPIRSGPNRPARGFDRGLRYEIAGVLHRIRSGRHGDGLPDWTSRRAVVGRREFARVPRMFLFCFLGRMAAGGASDLIIRGFPLLANFGTGTAPGGFPHFETRQCVSKHGGTS